VHFLADANLPDESPEKPWQEQDFAGNGESSHQIDVGRVMKKGIGRGYAREQKGLHGEQSNVG
jgi:hypothetical protein